MQETPINMKIIGAGLMTPKIAKMYEGKYPEVLGPWWLCEKGLVKGMQFVNAYGQINSRGGDTEALYGIRPVLAVRIPGIAENDIVELADRRLGEHPETFTCIWTMNGENAMIFCDRIVDFSPFRRDGGYDYRGSDAERTVEEFVKNIEGRKAVIRKQGAPTEPIKVPDAAES